MYCEEFNVIDMVYLSIEIEISFYRVYVHLFLLEYTYQPINKLISLSYKGLEGKFP